MDVQTFPILKMKWLSSRDSDEIILFCAGGNNPPLLRVYYEVRILSKNLEEEARQTILLLDYWAM